MKKIIILVLSIFSLLYLNTALAGSLGVSPLKYEFTVNSGDSKSGLIKVSNNSDSPMTLYTSKEDFIAGDDTGTPKFVKPEDQTYPELSLANWIKLEEENLTLAPRETREVKFKINVPKDGEPGGHYGAIFFSPGVGASSQVSIVQRLGVLLLINVPGDVKISGFVDKFSVGQNKSGKFEEKTNFANFPINFDLLFKNDGNVHLKPVGKIEILDENNIPLKNIGRATLTSPAGAYIGEKMVDFIPLNETLGNVLPKSERKFESSWEGFGYTVLNTDGTKSVKFKNLSDYYAEVASEKQAYLNFWEQVHTRTVSKNMKVVMTLSYEGKDKEKKDFKEEKTIKIAYDEKYVGINYYLIFILILLIGALFYYFTQVAPKNQARKEEELKRKIMEEMSKHK
ncbi:MAG: DUF916 domain-containing protein [Candidatus Gracilibacteria bacterium]|nr:DUF916 domain-containing protein [Candidatus Gracilibacteria bacterium]